MTTSGYFISFEGIDRCGKTTQAALLAETFGERAVHVREPGGTPLSERIREVLKDPDTPIEPRAEALLFAAARADLVEREIRPALANGSIVIADRYIDSSLAYQGAARGMGVDAIAKLNAWASGDLMPDLTILVTIDPERAAARGVEQSDRFEDEGIAFQRKVAEAYEDIARANPERIYKVDGDRSKDDVVTEIIEEVRMRLGKVG